jgi:hypothetical protein
LLSIRCKKDWVDMWAEATASFETSELMDATNFISQLQPHPTAGVVISPQAAIALANFTPALTPIKHLTAIL